MSPRIDHAVMLAIIVLFAAVAPGFAGATAETTEQLIVGVEQSGEDVTITVTQNASAVENASVTVEAENATYAGEGTYATDANGTVSFSAPAENVTVTIAASKGEQITTTTVDLLAVEDDGTLSVAVDQSDADVTVTVSDDGNAVVNASISVAALNNGSYAGEGEYTTDANGTVGLASPAENVTVEVTATKENASGTATAELVAVEAQEPEFENFGQRVSWFVHSLLDGDTEGGIGEMVSEFVKGNNPSNENRPDHAGPNADDHSKNKTAKGSNNGNGNDVDSDDDHPGKSKGKHKEK